MAATVAIKTWRIAGEMKGKEKFAAEVFFIFCMHSGVGTWFSGIQLSI